MLDLSSPAVLKDLLARYGFTFSKGLGQNFLINPTVCPRMAELGGAAPGVGMLEIGAGIGVLTAELARRADKVVCIEIDSRLLPILDETLAGFTNVRIVNDDVLKVDLPALLAAEFPGQKVAVCANLPYYITSPILMHLLESRLPLSSITVMIQKEAAARLTAEPGSREVGAISIALRYYCVPRVLFPVSRGSFLPSPDVDSTVIRLDIPRRPGEGRGPLLCRGAGGLLPAAQDAAQLCRRLLLPSEEPGRRNSHRRRHPGEHTGGTAPSGRLWPSGGRPL